MSAQTANLKNISLEDMEDMPVELSSSQAANDPDLLREDLPPAKADAEVAPAVVEEIDTSKVKEEPKAVEAEKADEDEAATKEAIADVEEKQDEEQKADSKEEAVEAKEEPKAEAKKKPEVAEKKDNTALPSPVVPIGRMHATMQAAREDAQDDLANGIRTYQNDGTAKPQGADKKEKSKAIPTPSSVKPSKGKGFGVKKAKKLAEESNSTENDVAWNDVMPRLYGSAAKASFAQRMLDKRPVRYGIIIGSVLLLHSAMMAVMDTPWWDGSGTIEAVNETVAVAPQPTVHTPLPPELEKINKEPVAEPEKVVQMPEKVAAEIVKKEPAPVVEAAKPQPERIVVAAPVAEKPEAPAQLVKAGDIAPVAPIVAPQKPHNETLLKDIARPAPVVQPAVQPRAGNGVDEDILYKILSRH